MVRLPGTEVWSWAKKPPPLSLASDVQPQAASVPAYFDHNGAPLASTRTSQTSVLPPGAALPPPQKMAPPSGISTPEVSPCTPGVS